VTAFSRSGNRTWLVITFKINVECW